MSKRDKLWVKPGWVTKMMTEYEKQRKERIANNQARMDALGLNRASNAFKASVEEYRPTSDDEYIPTNDEEGISTSSEGDEYDTDGANNESFRSTIKKVATMAPGHRTRLSTSRSTPMETPVERTSPLALPESSTNTLAPGDRTRSSTSRPTPMETPVERASPLALLESSAHTRVSSSVASTSKNRRARGVTKGKGTEKIVARIGPLPVEVSRKFSVPVGKNAPSLANELGKEVRASAPLQGVTSWAEIDDSIKAAIIQRTRDKFIIQGYDDDQKVRDSIDYSCARRYRDWKCVLHRHYKKLLKDGKDPKTEPCANVSREDWNYMVDNVWNKTDFMARSKNGEKARAQLPYNHACGSRSFPTMMSIMASESINGEDPHIVDFYKRSHWSKRKNNWVSDECRKRHEKFEEVRDRCSQPDSTHMTQEEMSIEVLGPRKGYLRGYGTGPKPSSSKSSKQFRVDDDEVNNLKHEIITLKELNETQQQQLEAQNKKFDDFQAFTMRMFETAGIFPGAHGAAVDDHTTT